MKIIKIPLTIAILLIPTYSFGSDDNKVTEKVFEPASFTQSTSSLQNRIKFPKYIAKSKEDRNVVIRCDVLVDRSGKLSENICFNAQKANRLYGVEIDRAAAGARIKAATISGTSRRVMFQYFVMFQKKGKSTLVEVFPNSGLQVQDYGPNYTSAQRYRENHSNWGAGCGFKTKVTIRAIIDKKGAILNAIAESENAEEKCKEYMLKGFLKGEFIPAFKNGLAVDSFYEEEISDGLVAR